MHARSILTLDPKCPHPLNGRPSNLMVGSWLTIRSLFNEKDYKLPLSNLGHVSFGGCNLKRRFTKKDLAKGKNKNKGSTSWSKSEVFTIHVVQVQSCDYTCIQGKPSWRRLLSFKYVCTQPLNYLSVVATNLLENVNT